MEEEIRKKDSQKTARHGWPFMLVLEENSSMQETGMIYQFHTGCSVRFSSLAEAILLMERRMEEMQLPKTVGSLRSFSTLLGETISMKQEEKPEGTGTGSRCREWEPASYVFQANRRAVFYIYVFYRQNSSWQGEIIWKERGEKRYFRSVLELLNLLDCACPKTALPV